MAPKKQDNANKKAALKEKLKIVEDKTFGLKNKNKSKVVQNYIKSVKANTLGQRVKSEHELKAESAEKAAQKRLEKENKARQSLLKAQAAMKKLSMAGGIGKQSDIARENVEPINIYVDPRDAKNANIDDEIKANLYINRTDIICKYFLQALQQKLYGWRWECPNGDQCQYRHAVYEGYVFKTTETKESSDTNTESIEHTIEAKRNEVQTSGPLTIEVFLDWVKRKEVARLVLLENSEMKNKKDQSKSLSGKQLYLQTAGKYDGATNDNDVDDDLETYLRLARESERATEENARLEADQNIKTAKKTDNVTQDVDVVSTNENTKDACSDKSLLLSRNLKFEPIDDESLLDNVL